PTSAPEVAPAPGEVLLAMNLPDYHPAFGRDPLAAGDWIVRGEGADEVGIVVAGPDHLTRTSLASPTLHWSLAKLPSGGVFHLTILDEDDEPVVLDRALPAPTRTGLQRLDLGALGVSLPIGPVLRWSIAWRPSEDAPPASFDFGWLRVVPLDAADAARIAAAPPGERVALLAEAGCFHEALDLALATEARAGATPDVERAITRLLEQAGLAELAASRAGGR
ncbi:MAG: DUF928 domain-containing protein, partial [Myxococcales bacterium]|nr:DUF928 domain-containing protein [Myxococcales bacterium]